MKCKYCGTQLNEEAVFCHKCGKSVQTKKRASEYEYEDDEPKKGNKLILTLLITLILLVLLVLSAVLSNWFFTSTSTQTELQNQMNVNQTPSVVATIVPETATQDDEPTKKPRATLAPTSADAYVHIEQPVYKTYTDSEFKFSCAYPSHFDKYIDKASSARYTIRANDGEITMKICAEENSAETTLQQSLSMFKSKHSGEVEYSSVGETYYAVRINDDGFCYYKYLRSKNNNFYWFEFTYPEDERDTYEGYIQHIYESFTVK